MSFRGLREPKRHLPNSAQHYVGPARVKGLLQHMFRPRRTIEGHPRIGRSISRFQRMSLATCVIRKRSMRSRHAIVPSRRIKTQLLERLLTHFLRVTCLSIIPREQFAALVSLNRLKRGITSRTLPGGTALSAPRIAPGTLPQEGLHLHR